MSRKKHHHKKRKSGEHGSRKRKTYTGKITITGGGFGFLTPPDGSPDIFIPPKYINGAMDGDIVEILPDDHVSTKAVA